MRSFLIFFLCLCLSVDGAAAQEAPHFQDYAVTVLKIGRPAEVRLEDPKSRRFATMLREGAAHKQNFAGHYTLTSWGCGASCIMTAVIDSKTGEVAWLPFTVCCWSLTVTEPLEYRLDSRLLIIHGSRDEHGEGTYFYEFDGRDFRLIRADDNPVQ
jgi:hypothetical protein